MKEKMASGCFFGLRHAFRAFDPLGNGNVTKEALYRILFNFLGYLSHQKFHMLLQRCNYEQIEIYCLCAVVLCVCRLNLNVKKVISFDEFFAKFRQTEVCTMFTLY